MSQNLRNHAEWRRLMTQYPACIPTWVVPLLMVNKARWWSTLILLLVCSSFCEENGHPLIICWSLRTAQKGLVRNISSIIKSNPWWYNYYFEGGPTQICNSVFSKRTRNIPLKDTPKYKYERNSFINCWLRVWGMFQRYFEINPRYS